MQNGMHWGGRVILELSTDFFRVSGLSERRGGGKKMLH